MLGLGVVELHLDELNLSVVGLFHFPILSKEYFLEVQGIQARAPLHGQLQGLSLCLFFY